MNRHLSAAEAAYIVNDCGAAALLASGALAPLAAAVAELAPAVRLRLSYGGEIAGFGDYTEQVTAASTEPLDDMRAGTDLLYSSATAAAQHPDHPTSTTTGDIGRLDNDGYLYLTDRKAFMIISGGVNIYPQEIENALALHPKIVDVAMIGIPDPEMGEQVKVVVQAADGETRRLTSPAAGRAEGRPDPSGGGRKARTMRVEHPVVDVENADVEIYYRCRRCARAWQRSFDVIRWFDDDGGLVELYRYHGMPVPSPRSGPQCAFCSSLTVEWSETPLPPAGAATPRGAGGVPWPSWRTWPRTDRADQRYPIPILLPLRPQLHPRTFRFP